MNPNDYELTTGYKGGMLDKNLILSLNFRDFTIKRKKEKKLEIVWVAVALAIVSFIAAEIYVYG